MAAADNRKYAKDLCFLARNVDKLTCGQVQVDLDSQEDRTFYMLVTPNDGYYQDATCKFRVCVPPEYPTKPPLVTCLNLLYHPNIDIDVTGTEGPPGGSVCVNLLDRDWQPGLGLDGCVQAVLYLLHHPNTSDPLSPVFEGGDMDEREFKDNVRAALRGEVVEGIRFDRLIEDSEPDRAETDVGSNLLADEGAQPDSSSLLQNTSYSSNILESTGHTFNILENTSRQNAKTTEPADTVTEELTKLSSLTHKDLGEHKSSSQTSLNNFTEAIMFNKEIRHQTSIKCNTSVTDKNRPTVSDVFHVHITEFPLKSPSSERTAYE